MFYFCGYQPTFGIPPIKKSVVKAEFSQEQTINANTSQSFNLPHPGYISTHFSAWHPGVDIATGLGMPIKPIAAGKIIEVTFGFIGYGNYVVVEHENGYTSKYAHMGQVMVKVGDTVTDASLLGQVGLTGRTTGPHTHLEVTKDGKSIDPLTILPKIDEYPGDAYYEARKFAENFVQSQNGGNPSPTPEQPKVVVASKVVIPAIKIEYIAPKQITPTPTPKIDLKAELSFDL